MRAARSVFVALAGTLAWLGAAVAPAGAQEFREFDTRGLPRSRGIVVRVSHPPAWKRVEVDDEMALAELRGPQGKLTGILQIGRGGPRHDTETLCRPERARTMLTKLEGRDGDTRITDVFFRQHQDRPAYEVRYLRNDAGNFMLVRSVIVCMKDSQVLVSCGGAGPAKAGLAAIEPVCRKVLESLAISEE